MQDEEIDEAFAATDAESFDADEPSFFFLAQWLMVTMSWRPDDDDDVGDADTH